MAPKQGNKYSLYFQKGKKKDLRAEHDSFIKRLEKVILTPWSQSLIASFWAYWVCRELSGVGRIQSSEVLHLSAVAEVWVTASSISNLVDFPPHTLKI